VSKRLQVVVSDDDVAEIRRGARREKTTVSEWVRRVLREAGRAQPRRDVARKLAAVRAATRHSFPTADMDRLLAEIEAGYGSEPRRPSSSLPGLRRLG
jgi:hypothetical protein